MFRRLNKVLFILVIILTANNAFADGSIYSLRGLGLLYYYYGGRATAMGGAVIAVSYPIDLNWLNPAALASVHRVRFSSQMLVENLNIENGSQKFKTNYANFNGFMGAFPIAKNIGIGFGLQPISKINYRFETLGKIDVYNYTKSVSSLGGLNRVFISAGFSIWSKLNLGVRFGYVFGKVDEDWRVTYAVSNFRDTFDQFRSKYKGSSTTFGAIFKPFRGLNIGGVYQTKHTINQDYEEIHHAPQITTGSTNQLEMPVFWGVGISYLMKQKFLWAFDYVNQDWSTYPTGSKSSNSEFTNFERISFGLEITPSFERFANFFQRNKYRVGFALEQPYVLDYSGKELSTILLTAGFGVPFASGSGSIDLAFEFGQRGNLPDNSFKEQIFRFSLYVTGNELWFQR